MQDEQKTKKTFFSETRKDRYGDERLTLRAGRVVGVAMSSFITLIIMANSYTTVSSGHVKVRTFFGEVSHEELAEGFHVVHPLATFSKYDTRQRTVTIDNIMVPSQDKLKTDMDVSIIYSLTAASASNVKQTVGSLQDLETTFLVVKARSLIRELGKGILQSQDFFLDSVQQQMQVDATIQLSEFMSSKGVVVHEVLFRDVTLPLVVSNAIIETKQRQEQVNQEKAALQIVEQKSRQVVVQAKAQEDAALSTANKKRTLADANAYEILTAARAKAEGNDLVKRSITPTLIEYVKATSWDGKYPTTMMGNDTPILMTMPVKSN